MSLKTRLSILEKDSPEAQPLIIIIREGVETPEQLQQIEAAENNNQPVKIINVQVIDSNGDLIHENTGSP